MRRVLAILLVLALAGAGTWYFLLREEEETPGELVLYGNVDIRQVELGFRISGRIAQMRLEEGDPAGLGEVLAVLDKTPYQDEVRLARAEAAAARLQSAEAALRFALEGFRAEDIAAARANLQAAEARLAEAQTRLADTEIQAPAGGVILTRVREPGAIVAAGQPVYTLSLTSPVWVRAYVDETELGRIHPGMAAEIRTDSAPNKIYHGQIGFISPVAEFTPKTVQTPELRTALVYRYG